MEPKSEIIFGRHPVLEAIQSGKKFDRIIIGKDLKGEIISEIKKAARQNKIIVQLVPAETLDKELRKQNLRGSANHQGVIGFTSMIEYHTIVNVIDQLHKRDKTPLLLMLEGITDVMNFGAIARSAECLGVNALIIPDKNFARLNHDAIKASAGALTRIRVCRTFSLKNACSYFKMHGIKIYGSALQAPVEIQKTDFAEPCCIIMGAEGEGISEELKEKCDAQFYIPMRGKTASLNVSVATGIVLYEARMQRVD